VIAGLVEEGKLGVIGVPDSRPRRARPLFGGGVGWGADRLARDTQAKPEGACRGNQLSSCDGHG
jgi:hypothetical protein